MAAGGDQPDIRKIYISNLTIDVTENDLATYCRRYGDIRDVHIPKDRYTNLSNKYGFVEFADGRSVEKILSEQTHQIHNQVVKIKKAHQKMFLYDIPREVTDDDLLQHFLKFGPILSVESDYKYEQNKPKRDCIILFETDNAVRKLEGLHIVKGVMLQVRIPSLNADSRWEDPEESTVQGKAEPSNLNFGGGGNF